MNVSGWWVTILAAGLFSTVALGQAAPKAPAAPKPPAEPSAEEIAKMEAAAPAQARVKPEKARKVLVFSISWGYWHDAIPWGKKAIEIMGRKSGAFEAVVSDDLANFEADKLAQFDAIFFNNTNNEIFLPESFEKLPAEEKAKAKDRDDRLKKNFVAYLQGGKGLAVIHAGVASFRQWPEYGNIVGARFTSHPWQLANLRVDEPGHPLAAAFKESRFTVRDEIYQMNDPFSRKLDRVLLSLDPEKTDLKASGVKRTDADFAMTWVKPYGQGRVFYNAFGHRHEIYWNPMILQHWLDGIQFVLGDLKADCKPK